MVDGSIGSRGSGGRTSSFDDFSTSLTNLGVELGVNPIVVQGGSNKLTVDGSVGQIGIHGRRVVTPNAELSDISNLGSSLGSELEQGTVVI